MTENDNKNNTAKQSGNTTTAGNTKTPASPANPEKTEVVKKKGRAVVVIDIVFNIILLCCIGFIGYMLYEQDKAVAVLFEQQNSLSGQRNDTLARINQLQATVQASVQEMENTLAATTQESAASVQELVQEQSAAIDRLQNELVSTRLRIADNNPGASQEWLLAEAASLLRLAQQHLVVANSVRTAQALFIAADDVLAQIDDPAIFSVREILAGELASIRSVQEVDIQEIYLQLGAVSGQVASLQVSNDLAVQIAEGETVSLAANEENAGLISRFFASVRGTLDNYLVVRRRDEPIQPLMTPGQEAALLQSVLLQIEQGRTALLKAEQEIYTASLETARATIDRYLSGEPALKSDILNTLDRLSTRRIVTETPPLTRTRVALEQILSVRESQIPVSAGPQ